MTKGKRLSPDYIFEASWEVCNKVGGIYTVLSTRAHTLRNTFKDKIIFIGPDLKQENVNSDFIESTSLLKAWKEHALKNENLKIRAGRWNVPGKPIVILIDFKPYFEIKNTIYSRMWEKFGVESLQAYGDYDEACMFAYASGLAIESFYKFYKLENEKVIAHFNEWMLGMGALYVKDKLPQVGTVFTTHATSIGRSIAGNNKPLYGCFEGYHGDQMALELNMEAKHSIEKQTALQVDCFTTVSKITAKECEQLLDKKPDIVTPNGFEDNFVPKGRNYNIKREKARKILLEVSRQLTGNSSGNNALMVAIGGRYEYKNKGIDVFIEAVNRFRWSNPDKKQVLAFILVPGWNKGPRPDLQSRLAAKNNPDTPLETPYFTHELAEPQNDKICQYLRYLDFTNQQKEPVKLIFVPSYLTGDDGIFNLPYYDLLIGMDMTIFPSYYEPWGYTPLESIAFGIPTVTTNLAGFGLWAKDESQVEDLSGGVEVIERTEDNYFEVADRIKDAMALYLHLDKIQQDKIGKAAKNLSGKASWTHFIKYYFEAYHIALKNASKRKGKSTTK
ncbi:MAG: glycogen/starch synthase [Dysgonamonadaceae bacterium]|jgi:glycosyltransferase involved in cell wall biosynthesis|nr:glycogen/starch synthase [Dysgonamonadaceae bacterium]